MIKQIALPSNKERQFVSNWGAIMATGSSSSAPRVSTSATEENVTAAENELNEALVEGYDIIAQYPFSNGYGINLILRKPD